MFGSGNGDIGSIIDLIKSTRFKLMRGKCTDLQETDTLSRIMPSVTDHGQDNTVMSA